MHSDMNSPWKRWVTVGFILFGFLLIVRLGWMGYSSRRVGRAVTPEEFRAKIQKIHDDERANLEASYRKAGIPLPPGGIDALFRPKGKTTVLDPTLTPNQ